MNKRFVLLINYIKINGIKSQLLQFYFRIAMQNSTQSNLFKSQNLSTIQSPDNFPNFKTVDHFSNHPFNNQADRNRNEDEKKDLELPENILKIANRRSNERSQAQNSMLIKFLLKRKIFKQLTEKLSNQVIKNMVRAGRLQIHRENHTLISVDKKVKHIYILLSGEVAIVKKNQKIQNFDENSEKNSQWDVLNELIEKIGKQSRLFRNYHKSNKKISVQTQKSVIGRKQAFLTDFCLQDYEKIVPECILDFNVLFDIDPKHSHTLVAVSTLLVFAISLQNFYECLQQVYNNKMNQLLKLFRKISIFDPFQNSQLKFLIDKLKVVEFKKSQYIYKQGDEPKCFYMLINGQVEISKTIQILTENPNTLYKNRLKVSRQKFNREVKVLPYANFNGVYNFFPQKKTITLSLISSICIFGEQQIINKSSRQVNAKIIGLNAQIYEIYLEDIEQICNKMIGSNGEKKINLIDFLSLVEENVTLKKILLRQNQLSELIEHQNKHKYKQLFQVNQQKTNRSSRNYHTRRFLSQSKKRHNGVYQQDQAMPLFNNLNFTEFIDQSETDPIATLQNKLSDSEMRVARLTHIKLSEPSPLKKNEKTIRLRNQSRELSNRSKYSISNFNTVDSNRENFRQSSSNALEEKISLQNPLFNLNYFKLQQRQQKRLSTQDKKRKLQNIYKKSPQKILRH